MPARALIIGIEHYPASLELAREITGATAAAERFFAWLTTKKHVLPGNVYVCADGGTFDGATRFSTEREKIVDAIAALVKAGQDQTEELFVFYSGHGYCFQESLEKRAIDVLIASDFESAAASGTRCLKLEELQDKLYAILGGRHHYYFVDACRTMIRDSEIDPIGLGRKLGAQAQRGAPTKYTLYSTAYGTAAAINSAFAPALLDGLAGKGRAKGFVQTGQLYVMFQLLCEYVQGRTKTQKIDQKKDGSGDGFILEIAPVPQYSCSILVDGAAPTETFTARLSAAGNPALASEKTFTGSSFTLPFTPGSLVLDVLDNTGQPLTRIDPPAAVPMDFFDNCSASFRRPPRTRGLPMGGPPPPPPPVSAEVRVMPLPDVTVVARNLQTGEKTEIPASESRPLPPGDYELAMQERGTTIRRTVTALTPGRPVDVGTPQVDPVRESIIAAVHGDPRRGIVAFSETLGDIANPDLGLWLTIMGASHIIRDPSTFSKLRDLPLDDVQDVPANGSGAYVLAVTPDGSAPAFDFGAGWEPSRLVAGLTGVYQARRVNDPGARLIAIRVGAAEPRTFASFAVPNRITFLVFAPGERGELTVHQFLLAAHHLSAALPPYIGDRIREHPQPLRAIRTAYAFQAQFARGNVINPPDAEDRAAWDELLFGKWIDPVMSLLACYEILRRGDEASKGTVRNLVVPNLDQYFPGIPDTAAIAASVGLDRPMPAYPPLFRDGLHAFPDWEQALPLPAGRLDYGYVWTTWRAALR
jgi:caspase domain-containing protein